MRASARRKKNVSMLCSADVHVIASSSKRSVIRSSTIS